MAAYAASILHIYVCICINISCPVLEYLSLKYCILLTAKTRREVNWVVNYTFERLTE
jgi:hypothetical protein